MADRPVINIVGTTCQPADEAKFNRWYNEVHIPMLLKYKKLLGVTRYKVAEEDPNHPRYIAIYKYARRKDLEDMAKSPAFEAAVKEMRESWGQKIEVTSRVVYEVIKEWG
jgi:hypothetical protein